LLAVIGRNWLNVSDDDGSRRLDNPHDFLRVEIATALEAGIYVIPVLVAGAKMPRPNDLPEDLVQLSRRHAQDVPDIAFHAAVSKLINVIQEFEAEQRLDLEAAARRKAEEEQRLALEAVTRRKAEEEQRLALEAETRRKAEEEQRLRRLREEAATMREWMIRGSVSTDLDEQVHAFSQAIRLQPDNATAYLNRGNARYSKGDLAGALLDYNEAIRLRPDYADAFHSRANARYKTDITGARRDYAQAIRFRSESPADLIARKRRQGIS
jgi:tetratricopeptide (TPR) repeat protein